MKGFFKVLLGLGVGAAIGMLLAPKSGRELREQLVGGATRRMLPAAPDLYPQPEQEREWAATAVEEPAVLVAAAEDVTVVEAEPSYVVAQPLVALPLVAPEPWVTEETTVREETSVVEEPAPWEAKPAFEESAPDEVLLEETVVIEDRVITEEGVVEDVVTYEERIVDADGTVLEETFVREEMVPEEPALVEEPAVEAAEPDDLRARIEATRAEIEESLAQPFGGETLEEDTGMVAPADAALVADAPGGDTRVEEPLVEETVIEETVVEQTFGDETVVEETVSSETAVEEADAVTVIEETVEQSVVIETPAGSPLAESRVWPEAAAEASVADAVVVQDAPESVAPEVVEEPVAAPHAWDMWQEEEKREPVPETDAARPEVDAAEPVEAPPVVAEEPIVVAEPEVIAEPFVVAEQPEAVPGSPAPVEAVAAVVEEPVEAEPSPRETGSIDQAEMRRRIEETRARLKAKAFDAMMSGEAALLGRDDDAQLPRQDDIKLDGDVESTIDESLSQEDY